MYLRLTVAYDELIRRVSSEKRMQTICCPTQGLSALFLLRNRLYQLTSRITFCQGERTMQKTLWIGGTVLFGLIMSNTTVFAADINHFICRSLTIRPATWTEDLKLFAFDDKGIIVGQIEQSAFHAMNSQCVAVVKRGKGLDG